jgi:phosphoribosylglycinamide formyltransferase-1
VSVPVQPDDDAATLAARVLRQEHRIYPQAVRWFAEGRLRLTPAGVALDGGVLAEPVRWQAALP